jgi:DNA-binding LacI/PurR family transcriptional regulator
MWLLECERCPEYENAHDVLIIESYSLVLCNSDEDPAKEKLYIDVMRAESVAGVIIASASEAKPHIDDLLDAQIPVVALDRRIKDRRVDSVLTTNAQGAYAAVTHLIGLGHRCIGFISLPLTRTTGRERFEGYQRALRENGLPVARARVRISNAKQPGGHAAALDLLTSQPCLTALFAANNLTTLGALDAIRERGLEIPDDISIIGFDDMPWATLLRPPLTAIAQPTYELGQQAAELLLARLKDPGRPVSHVQLNTTLVVRGSTSAPRQ